MLFANYLTDTNEALLFLSYAIINQPKLNLQERPAAGAGARSAWGRASAPTSASSIDARSVVAAPRIDLPGFRDGEPGSFAVMSGFLPSFSWIFTVVVWGSDEGFRA